MPAPSEWYQPGQERHRRYDEYGVIQVFDDGNKRYLCFGNADEQSCLLRSRPEQLQHEYARAMLAVLALIDEIEVHEWPVTLLGLGGGTLASALLAVQPQATITAVELRQAVVRVARQYFSLPRTPRLRIEVMDAGAYLRTATAGQARLLVSDLYLAEGADPQQLQQEYLEACWLHLAEGGWLVVNLWCEHRDQAAWLCWLKQRFGQVLHATTSDGNWIIWAQKIEQVVELPIQQKKQIRQRCKALSTVAGFNFWRSVKPFLSSS
ncbi:MAG: spermidine synthase [Oceanobacter sp.]